MRPKSEVSMIARTVDLTQASETRLAADETPLQRQIILWQRELVRRAESRRQVQYESAIEA
jgi:hypothetical protein